jgi:hypothetical protein
MVLTLFWACQYVKVMLCSHIYLCSTFIWKEEWVILEASNLGHNFLVRIQTADRPKEGITLTHSTFRALMRCTKCINTVIEYLFKIYSWILTENYTIFKLRSDLDTFYLYLYSCSHQPYNGHMSGLKHVGDYYAMKLHP